MEMSYVQYSKDNVLEYAVNNGVANHKFHDNFHIGDMNDLQKAVEKEYEWRLKFKK